MPIRIPLPYKHRLHLLDRYILRQLVTALVALTGGAVALIWLTQSLHFVSMVVQHGLSLGAFLHLTLLMVPTLIGVILPISTFLVILFIYHKLAGDRELTVMRAAGVSPLKLARPGLLCALLATAIAYALSLWLSPVSYHAFHRYEFEIRNRVAAFLLEDGVFTPISNTMTIYVHTHDADNVFRGVLIQDNRLPKQPTTILAEQALMIPRGDALNLVLYNGSRQAIDPQTGQLGMLDFQHDTIELNAAHATNRSDQDAAELSLHALFSPPAYIPSRYRSKLAVEGWTRLTTPLSTFSYAIIGLACVLRGRFSRYGSVIRPFVAILSVVGLLLLSLILKGMAARQLAFVPLLWAEIILPIILCGALIVQEHRKGQQTVPSLSRKS